MEVGKLWIATLALAVFAAAPALACPVLKKADPRVGATVKGSVDHVTLYFSGEIDAGKSDLNVFDAKGHNVTQGKPEGQGDPPSAVSVPVRATAPGVYTVKWHILCHCEGSEGNIFPGDYHFIIQK